MKRNAILFVLLTMFCFVIPAYGYFSMSHPTEPLEVRACTTGYFGIYTTEAIIRELTFPPDGTPCPYSSAQSFVFLLDGEYYRQGMSGGDMIFTDDLDDYFDITYVDSTQRQLVTRWCIPGTDGEVIVRQILRPVTEDGLAMIKVIYEIQNNTFSAHTVGIRTILDPLLAGYDGAVVSVGDYIGNEGVYFDEDIPEFWQAYEVGIDYFGDQLITRGKAGKYCDQFGLGNAFSFVDLYSGVKSANWDFADTIWIDNPFIDLCASSRWDARSINVKEVVDFSYYYGFGKGLPSDSAWINRSIFSNLYASITDCNVDSIQNLSVFLSSSFSPLTDVEICMHFSTSSELYFESGLDEECISLGDLTEYESNIVDFNFNIPPGYSSTGDEIDTIFISARSSDTFTADIEWSYEFITPYFSGTPPEITLLNRDDNFIGCEHVFQFTSTDDDTSINAADIRVSINGTSYGAYTGLFTTIRPTTSITLDTLLITNENDTIRLSDMVIYCVSHLEDIFGCESDLVCDSFYFDLGLPYISAVFPNPGDTRFWEPGDDILVYALMEDDYSGLRYDESMFITYAINNFDPENFIDTVYHLTTAYIDSGLASGDSIMVCVQGADNVIPGVSSSCEPHIIDSCWVFYISSDEVSLGITLDDGWRIISNPFWEPFELASTIPSAVTFSEYNRDTRMYTTPTYANAEVGYWALMPRDTHIVMTGETPVDETTLNLYPGWNLIGSLYEPFYTAVFDDFPEILSCYGYFEDEYHYIYSLFPGEGCWLLATDSISVTIPGHFGFGTELASFEYRTVPTDSARIDVYSRECTADFLTTVFCNCGMDSITAEMDIDGNVISLNLTEHTSTPTFSFDYYRVEGSIRFGFNGRYTLEVNSYPFDGSSPTLIDTATIEVNRCH